MHAKDERDSGRATPDKGQADARDAYARDGQTSGMPILAQTAGSISSSGIPTSTSLYGLPGLMH